MKNIKNPLKCICECGNEYFHRQSLSKHKKQCNFGKKKYGGGRTSVISKLSSKGFFSSNSGESNRAFRKITEPSQQNSQYASLNQAHQIYSRSPPQVPPLYETVNTPPLPPAVPVNNTEPYATFNPHPAGIVRTRRNATRHRGLPPLPAAAGVVLRTSPPANPPPPLPAAPPAAEINAENPVLAFIAAAGAARNAARNAAINAARNAARNAAAAIPVQVVAANPVQAAANPNAPRFETV